MKFMKLKYYLAPIFIKEVNNISEKYINLIKEIQETNNYEKTLEFNELRNSITLRIEEIDKFFEQNFDKPFIFNFEKGRIRLKKLLMYEPELFNKIDNKKNINGMAFGQTINNNNNDINNISQNYEKFLITNNNNNNDFNKDDNNSLNEAKISLSSKRNCNKSVEKDFNNNNNNINNNNNNNNNLTTRFKEKNLNLYENYNNFNKKKKNNKIFNNNSININNENITINNEKNNEKFNNSISFNKNRNNSYDKKSNIKYYNLNDSNNNNNNLNKKQFKKFFSKKLNIKNNKNDDNNFNKNEQNNNKNDINSKKNLSSNLREKKEIIIKFKLTEEEYKHLLKLKAMYINQ